MTDSRFEVPDDFERTECKPPVIRVKGGRLLTGPVGTPIGGPGWTEAGYMADDGESDWRLRINAMVTEGLKAGQLMLEGVNINPAVAPDTWVQYHWFEQELARFTYKPNFEFRLIPGGPFQGLILRIKARVPDARWRPRPEWGSTTHPPVISIAAQITIPEHLYGRSELFAEWLLAEVLRVETHEAQEWLRRDGEIYQDPHKQPELVRLPVGPIHNNEPDELVDSGSSVLRRFLSKFARP